MVMKRRTIICDSNRVTLLKASVLCEQQHVCSQGLYCLNITFSAFSSCSSLCTLRGSVETNKIGLISLFTLLPCSGCTYKEGAIQGVLAAPERNWPLRSNCKLRLIRSRKILLAASGYKASSPHFNSPTHPPPESDCPFLNRTCYLLFCGHSHKMAAMGWAY